MNTVAIVDYGMCNLDSVARAIEECGGKAIVTDRARDLDRVNRIILPGVGAFPDAMQNIRERSLDEVLYEQVFIKEIPILGICLGMQIMATIGHEGRNVQGLGWIPGRVIRMEPFGDDTRIPHIGWNEVYPVRPSTLFSNIEPGRTFISFIVITSALTMKKTSWRGRLMGKDLYQQFKVRRFLLFSSTRRRVSTPDLN